MTMRKDWDMRVIGSAEVGGVEYTAIWATLSSIQGLEAQAGGKGLAVRTADGKNESLIRHNAKLAVIEEALRHLRTLGLNDSHLGRLFNYKGNKKGMAKHVRGLVCNMT